MYIVFRKFKHCYNYEILQADPTKTTRYPNISLMLDGIKDDGPTLN